MGNLPIRAGCTLGIDVSGYQGQVDWSSLFVAGVRWCSCKATENLSFIDKQWKRNVETAPAGGMMAVLPYHFFHPGRDPIAQARHFYEVAGGSTGRPVVDFETMKGVTYERAARDLLTFIMEVEGMWKCEIIIYSGPSILTAMFNNQGEIANALSSRDLWVAHWGVNNPKVPRPWTKWVLWQFDGDKGLKMPNGGDADFDWFKGDESHLSYLLRPSHDTLPAPPPEE
jgi:lysozyme